MKKLLCLLLSLLFVLSTCAALAEPDQPFKKGVNYGSKWSDYGAATSMLNFGYANLAPGESLFDASNHKETNTVKKKIKASQVEQMLDEGITFYMYAKWQCDKAIGWYKINAMSVVTDPEGNYYASEQSWTIEDCPRRTIYSWFHDVTNSLQRIRDDNGGTLPRGSYTFSLFFNEESFRSPVKISFQ